MYIIPKKNNNTESKRTRYINLLQKILIISLLLIWRMSKTEVAKQQTLLKIG